MDDIIIFAKGLNDHEKKLTEIFERLRKYKLRLQPSKCSFLRREIVYLGHVLTTQGIRCDPAKLSVLRDYARPKNVKSLQSFLGFCNYYRRFIPHFSEIVLPLTKLLRKNEDFIWEKEQEESFCQMKQILTEDIILQYPDFDKEFILATDASDYSIGAVLSQNHGQNGKEINDQPIAYMRVEP